MKNKTCIIIVGPTAVGKTAIAVQLAQHFSTQIISADSRQCFKELGIGVAKPSAEELQLVKHYFINSHSINEEVNAAVMVGGTGLYVKAFCEGMDIIPAVDVEIRKKITTAYETNGIAWLQKQVEENDPLYFEKGETKNPQRLMRALEIKLSTGTSILEFHTKQKKERDFTIIKLGLELPKEQLYQNINHRVDAMVVNGLIEEAKELLPCQHLNALQTVGYKELFEYFNEEISLQQAIEKIKLNTRHYAKRQMTWFKKDAEIKWCDVDFKKVLQQIRTSVF